MKLKKKEIQEIIDANGELIGSDDIPKNGSNLETQANNTTDHNAKIAQQPYRYDMMGRFGFNLMPFYEGEDKEPENELLDKLSRLMYDKYMEMLEYYYRNPNKLKSDFRIQSEKDYDSQPEEKREIDKKWAKKIISTIHPYLEEKEKIDEGKVVEDKVIEKKNEDEISKKSEDKEVRDKKIEKIAGLINKLDKKDIDKLMNLLERK